MDFLIGYQWSNPQAVQPALLNAMYCSVGPRTARGRLVHRAWVLDYTYEPAGLYRAGEQPGPWSPRPARTAHLYAPGTPYQEDGRRARRHHAAALVFTGGEAAGLEGLLCPQRRYVRFEDPHGQLGKLVSGAARTGNRLGEGGFWAVQAEFCRVLELLLQSRELEEPGLRRIAPPAAGTLPEEGLAARVDAYLRRHLAENAAEPVTLARLAREMHISVSSLSHRYRREAGVAPLARLAAMRIEQAGRLLLLGHPLKAIAPALGFCDAFHLSRAFKRELGCSPRTFLQTERGRAEGLNLPESSDSAGPR
jgi:AraC-like DNA-binding protein